MPISGAVFGGAIGLFVQFYSNAVRKLPLLHHPWEHALYAGIGAYAGSWLVEYEQRAKGELQAALEERAERNSRIPHSGK